ncbi:MAG: MBL fold metallo-hydrolase [Yaniella sp.]|uniref:MBL fold metallo-hydrolase n=1 Tax=Yaniella sp. TaxID=2773929 RepID=UPI002648FC34|nr:MBL fold metallo-hydrolase [Yaniella sp.]MDN5732103.1 MBL fold metallo-hydrolase [Yaniella sp.]MDN5890284.1 MBL fold metallo-hydrolase [Yaniella sp.]MDN6148628.1 MBL fold metallo-hydrolase [Yaniella sp.]MDN6456317.1 MBL fold metallo-hydrolase [Yaniella sp.]MDN6521342.1 MBL fold metallo-hydrolase [Yaniella sp.]
MSSSTTLASSQFTFRVTQNNPSGMTLSGTNTYVLGAPDAQTVVIVDPGFHDGAAEHADAVAEVVGDRSVELILVTHHHFDHTGAVETFHERFGAPVRAVDEQWCRQANVLVDNEVISAAGTQIRVVATPGHTSDSVSFYLPEDNTAPHPGGTVLTGDTILGEGTTMLDYPDGTLDDYLQSMNTLGDLEGAGRQVAVLPAHGPTLDSVARTAQDYYDHRMVRVDQLRELIADYPPIPTPVDWESVTVHDLSMQLYPKLPDVVRVPAKKTLAATLEYLMHNTKE